MVRKRYGKREYIFLFVAGLTFFSLLSCARIEERPVVIPEEKKAVTEEVKPCLPEIIFVPGNKEEVAVPEKKDCSHLGLTESLAKRRDPEALMKQYQEMLNDLPKDRPADEILFVLGLLQAHPENPQKNYKKAQGFFRRVLKEYPSGLCAAEAKIWVGVLDDIENAAKVDLEIEQKKKELGK